MGGLIVLNFKTYVEATGERALLLARVCDRVAGETEADIIVCPQVCDLYRIASEVSIPVYAQHVDDVKAGSSTGWILPEAAAEAGVAGSLVNHSEHRLKIADIDSTIRRLKDLELKSIVCTNNIAVSKACAALGPNYVAVEPPELIGSGISVSEAQPEIVTGSVEAVLSVGGNVGILCGAGITKGSDVRKALEYGTEGVLLASGVVKAKDPEKVLLDLVSGLD